jgi:hypothetical protein
MIKPFTRKLARVLTIRQSPFFLGASILNRVNKGALQ